MNNKEKGDEAEKLALNYLKEKGYTFRTKNYRFKKGEIDLIMEYDRVLVFFEIKARQNNYYGYPEAFINKNQASLIMKAAENYIMEQNWQGRVRVDVIAITQEPELKIKHFTDALH